MWHTRRSILCISISARLLYSFLSLARDQHGLSLELTRELGFHIENPGNLWGTHSFNVGSSQQCCRFGQWLGISPLFLSLLPLFLFQRRLETWVGALGISMYFLEALALPTTAMGGVWISKRDFGWLKSRQEVEATGMCGMLLFNAVHTIDVT